MNALKIVLPALLFIAPLLVQGQGYDHAAGGCGPAKADFDVKTTKNRPNFAEPPEGKAMVYVIQTVRREPDMIGSQKATTRVGMDGAWMGANHGDTYFFFPVEPGQHSICTDWQSSLGPRSRLASAADLTTEAGGIYYFVVKVREPMVRENNYQDPGEVKIEPIDAAEGKLLIGQSEFAESHAKK